MKNLIALIAITVALATPPQPYPGRVEVRGRQHFAVRGQPVRNWVRWWFGSVPVPPQPVQQ
jgi:hypothetical protein